MASIEPLSMERITSRQSPSCTVFICSIFIKLNFTGKEEKTLKVSPLLEAFDVLLHIGRPIFLYSSPQ